MKVCTVTVLSAFVITLVGSAALSAQDPAKVASENYTVLFENASVRVLKVKGAPGMKTAVHAHPDHLAVFLTAAKMRFTTPDGKSQDADTAADSAIYAPAGPHAAANVGTTNLDGVIVEFKAKQPGTAAIPSSRDNMTLKVLAEGPHAVAHRVTADAKFQEPAGTKHDYDQVVIALTPGQMSLSLDGKPTKSKWARGDVQFIGRGTPHETHNTGGKPIDYVIVAIK